MAHIDRSLIAPLALFKGLNESDLDGILEGAHARRFEKDAAIFRVEEQAQAFFLLLSGHVRVVRTNPAGDQVIARYISDGELFGIAPAIGRTTYPATAIAAVDCVVLSWPTTRWAPLAAAYPVFATNTYALVGKRLQEAQDRIVEISTEQVEQRVAHALLRLVKQTGRKTQEGLLIDFPISRQDIAEMTGTTLHTVSRILSGWEHDGLVKCGRQKVTICDAHGLFLIGEGRRGL